MLDRQGRTIEYLRVSVTDRCNYRCVYCMPEGGVPSMAHGDVLTFEEIVRLVRLAAGLGVRVVRVTGGEPMARRGCLELVRAIRGVPGIARVTMTTNGALLKGRMAEAKAMGLDGVNISLDTLDPEVFRRMTRLGDVGDVLSALDEAIACGLQVKVNAVPVRGLNEEGLTDLAALARTRPVDVRFIELMPVGCGAAMQPVPTDEVLRLLEAAFGPMTPDDSRHGFGPARYMKPEGFTGSIGVIGAVTHGFCETCNRVRLTADGRLKLCLNHLIGLDLRAMLRGGAGDEEITSAMREAIARKPARHGFLENVADRESRRMNEIGG
ncbi:MAG: GTP 3',8-cyclase MoaA [Aristaeellaceae bacterium]